MKTLRTVLFSAATTIVFVAPSLNAFAQTPIQLFGSTFVRTSSNGASATSPITFNSATVNLTCPSAGSIRAVLSSTPDGSGHPLADNFIQVTVTAGSNTTGPTNVCRGGTLEAGRSGTQMNCFTPMYEGAAANLLGQNMDTGTFTASGGVPPIDISGLLVQGAQQAKFEVVDTGGELTNASLYLVTSCTEGGVTGPATVTGNPIPGVNPPPSLLVQNFGFDTAPGQGVGFTYDISTPQQNGNLQLTDNTIPNAADMPLDPTLWQTQYATGTSFATSSCLIHRGELLNGQSACKLYTLTCQVGTGTSSSGALCPVSQLRDEIFSDRFTGPAFTLPDITGPTGRTYHQGVGLLMAAEGWAGGPCTFSTASGLQAQDCPQNLLTFFSSPGIPATPSVTPQVHSLALVSAAFFEEDDEDMDFDGTGTHPNSTFVTVSGVPEDLTTVIVVGQFRGGWVNTHNVKLWMWSEPPVLPSTVPNHQNFVASPIQSLTYGISPASTVLSTKFAIPGDVTLTNSNGCPTPGSPNQRPASIFAVPTQTVHVQADGQYLLHYFAQDCAGTEELQFSSVGNGGWATSFFTVPVNVDTVDPRITQGPTLSPAGSHGNSNSYAQHSTVTASYSCSDDASGIAICGDKFYDSPGTLNTGILTSTVDTSTLGSKTFTVWAVDIAGNIVGEPQTVRYTVVPAVAVRHP
jgi:hypothetical protein